MKNKPIYNCHFQLDRESRNVDSNWISNQVGDDRQNIIIYILVILKGDISAPRGEAQYDVVRKRHPER
ncbi:MAG: hypothetical protein CO137_03150 [Candidatus Magasanikbacteria bacterium CG_4_9_14_3_um_filter_32_9]|uniref:Uncharacterized protein n=1 Tax=Candidatus Magasanikbacteria bacterium CG_4_9_14_3_um_filter_32_9 TaxID=1974644 RepID=A0A2M7Z6A5_9BACT|nr:MAG: hypothetical protein CO137_03150 [Candidatus Magasanikbacteria bacterium CG_4_9_14_3_um_filter_32_9]